MSDSLEEHESTWGDTIVIKKTLHLVFRISRV